MKLTRLLSSFALFLAGCAQMGNDGRGYPSLSRRPVEMGGTVAQIVPATAQQAQLAEDTSDLTATLAVLVERLRQGARAFDAAYARTAHHVGAAAGAAVSSESWVIANLGISALESARNESVSALASLDTLYIERMKSISEGKVAGAAEAIDAARREALGTVDDQNDRLDGLKSRLRQP
jgi:hypothetical protein